MNSQNILKAIINDNNVALLELTHAALYEKSNLLVEAFKNQVAENILKESEYNRSKYLKNKKHKRRKFLFAVWKNAHSNQN